MAQVTIKIDKSLYQNLKNSTGERTGQKCVHKLAVDFENLKRENLNLKAELRELSKLKEAIVTLKNL